MPYGYGVGQYSNIDGYVYDKYVIKGWKQYWVPRIHLAASRDKAYREIRSIDLEEYDYKVYWKDPNRIEEYKRMKTAYAIIDIEEELRNAVTI